MRISLAQVDSRLGDDRRQRGAAPSGCWWTPPLRTAPTSSCFPELHLCGYSIGEVGGRPVDASGRPADRRGSPSSRRPGRACCVGFVGGAAHQARTTYNSTAYYEDGRLVHVHRKLYLPDVRSRSRSATTSLPGPRSSRAFPVLPGPTPGWRCCVCNDAWQPQLALHLATQDGAQVHAGADRPARRACSPTATTRTSYWRRHHPVLRADVPGLRGVRQPGRRSRAGSSSGVARTSSTPGAAWSPRPTEDEEQVLTVDIDLADIRRRRRQVPLVKEARLGLIQREIARLLDEGGDM
ncbi:MAG: nitrilase-related carbon-nitrogen hydrolase [Nocardioidaceae bacterium]